MIEGSLFETVKKRFSKHFETRDLIYNVLKKYVYSSKNITIKKEIIIISGISKTNQKELKFKEFELLEQIQNITKIQYSILFQ
jgi:hypothetical protein